MVPSDIQYADHRFRGHWFTPIPSQKLVFALFLANSLDGLFIFGTSIQRPFFPKTSWNVDLSKQRTHLHWLQPLRTREVFLCKINKCLSLCIIQFQVAFLDILAECVEWQWFSKVLLSPCDYVHHGSITVSQTIPSEGSMVMCIQPLAFTHRECPWLAKSFHNIMNCGWWNTFEHFNWLTQSLAESDEPRPIHACKHLSLWWMFFLYSILIASHTTS